MRITALVIDENSDLKVGFDDEGVVIQSKEYGDTLLNYEQLEYLIHNYKIFKKVLGVINE